MPQSLILENNGANIIWKALVADPVENNLGYGQLAFQRLAARLELDRLCQAGLLGKQAACG